MECLAINIDANHLQKYVIFKSKINNLLAILKQNKKYENINTLLDSIANKNTFITIFLFQNYDKWINIDFDNINNSNNNKNNKNNNCFQNLFNIKTIINETKKQNMFCIIIQWFYFIYLKLIENFYSESSSILNEINKIQYLLKETNLILIQLYKSKILNTSDMFNLLYFLLFLIENNNEIITHSDKAYKIKNYILLKTIFFIFGEISNIILEKVSLNLLDDEKDNKNDIEKIFKYLEDFQSNKEISSQLNNIILINQNILVDFIKSILHKINFKIMNKYDANFKNKIINFYSHFINKNYKKSNIFCIFIDYLKNAFINLYDFKNNKDAILLDLFIQGLYIKLIKKLFFFEENSYLNKLSTPSFNSFYFNGYDSEISLKYLTNKNLEKTSIFFSFNFVPINNKENIPLFIIEKDPDKKNSKEVLLSIYLQKKLSNETQKSVEEYELYIYKDKNNNENKIDNIISNTNYYFNITFSNKICISLYNEENNIRQKEIEIERGKKIFDTNINLTFGSNKKYKDTFSGYIGPIIIIKNPSLSKENKHFISSILQLRNYYPYFIFLEQSSTFSLEYFNHFQNNYIINEIKKKIETINIECLLYLTPDTVRYINDIKGKRNTLQDIGNICPNQKDYKINNINITLVKYEHGLISFLMDNGLNYICLLYEYIYQFMYNYTETNNKNYLDDEEILFKIITSIFKKSLFILEKVYSEIKFLNFNKQLKQIYMNLFSCLKIITSKKYYILDYIINNFFNIIISIRSNISDILFKNTTKSNELNDDNENKNNLNLNLIYLSGLLDFLVTPELYDFNNTKTLIELFHKLSSYFNFDGAKESSAIINQHFYLKLLSFTPFLNQYFEQYENDEDTQNIIIENNTNTNTNDNDNDIENIKEKKEVLLCYLKALKSFFKNNPSKNENIINLQNIFKYINEDMGNNYQLCLGYYTFIKDLIADNPDIYFNEEHIQILLYYGKKYSNNIFDSKDENKIEQKKTIFYKLMSIIVRIIFTKNRINKNIKMVHKFKKLIQEIDLNLSEELISKILEEINHIIDISIGASKNNRNKKKKIDYNEQKRQTCTAEDLKYISNFYSEIFNLIIFFLEYPKNDNNSKKNEIQNIHKFVEEKIYELIEIIQFMIKGNFENNSKIDFDKNNENNNDNNKNGLFTIDTIYCLINFVKFFYNILSNKIYPENYIKMFINLCKLCCETCLINSNILVDIENSSKTVVEIILDICINYIIKTCKLFFNPSNSEEIITDQNEDMIFKEQTHIFNFVNSLFPNKNNVEKKHKYTIFYNNDYLRYLYDNSLKSQKDNTSMELKKEFRNYKIIYDFLVNEQKFNLNFTTFFLIKLGGYNKLLIDLNISINSHIPDKKEKLELNNLFQLIVESMHLLYDEQEELFSLNRDFFFKSKKANATGYTEYLEVKKRIEYSLKKKNYTQVDQYIINEMFKDDYENQVKLTYSGLCKKDSKSFSFNIFQNFKKSDDIQDLSDNNENKKGTLYGVKHFAYSSTNLIKDLQKKEEKKDIKIKKTFFKQKTKTFFSKSINLDDDSLENSINNNKKNGGDNNEDDFEFIFEDENPSSESNTNSIILLETEKINNNINKNINLLHSPTFQRMRLRQKTVSSKLLPKFFDLSDKKSKNTRLDRSASFYTTSSKESDFLNYNDNNNIIIPYINFFDQPDEYYLKNAKKEIMMNIFSLYFFEHFFYNDNFMHLKDYYLQNFVGIQKSTKKLDFPCKMKNFNNGLEPNLFLKPFNSFFTTKVFPVNFNYYYEYLTNNRIFPNQIILYKKQLPDFNLKNQFDQKCELIKPNHSYYGHIIGSKDYNFFVFEEKKYEFYQEMNNIISQKIINYDELDDLFTLSLIDKKPPNKHQEKVKRNLQNILKRKKNKENKIVIILFNEIEEILERRCLLMWQAIEIYLKNGKSYFFNFLTNEKCKYILNIFKSNKITKDKVHEKDYFRNQKNIGIEWSEERLSTNEYLLFINKYSSRTFSDANQYPIFPWLRRYISNPKEKDERIFKYPMAAQNEENQKIAYTRFSDDEDNNIKYPAHFGTHYSTSAYVFFYLMREEPFSTILVKLQGYKKENADRMFHSLDEVLCVLSTGHDNREMIPDLFYKIEHYINLNCADFGMKNKNVRVDDFIVNENKQKKQLNNKEEIYQYVKFILDNRKLLDDKKISFNINDWIDNIFGVGQLPEKNTKKTLNIFYRETYEQKTNLYNKLIKFKDKNKKNKKIEDLIHKITNKIDLIISFGQTPYQLFIDKHPKYGKKTLNGEGDFEYDLIMGVWDKNIKTNIDMELPLFFIINEELGKVFLIDKKRQLDIIDNMSLFDQKGNEKYQFKRYGRINLSHIKFLDKIYVQNDSIYYIYKQKYCISSFNENNDFYFNQINIPKESDNKPKKVSKDGDKIDSSFRSLSFDKIDESENYKINYNDCKDNDYISYYNLYVNKLNFQELKKESKKTKKIEYFRVITCRYIDNTFKIYNLPKKNPKDKNVIPMSYVCEDFVTSCCAISYNKFLVGLKNGKLIQWSIEEVAEDLSSKKQNIKNKLQIKFNRQIQAHKSSINVIEINHKIGIIITAGSDNYIFIRKIYDLELLIPIKIKSKYIITMAKVSPTNFLYIMCYNTIKEKSCIFGYTLNGLNFSKSNYEHYDTIDFTKSGNIVTWVHQKEIQILSGYSLKIINIHNKELSQNLQKLKGAAWVKFNYFHNRNEKDSNIKIFSYISNEKNKAKQILTLDVTKNKYFD